MPREFKRKAGSALKNISVLAVITAVFSACILVLSLITAAETAAVNDLAAELKTEIEEIKSENELLEIKLNMSASLEEIERYALEVLGMQHLRPEQVTVLDD